LVYLFVWSPPPHIPYISSPSELWIWNAALSGNPGNVREKSTELWRKNPAGENLFIADFRLGLNHGGNEPPRISGISRILFL